MVGTKKLLMIGESQMAIVVWVQFWSDMSILGLLFYKKNTK